MENRETNASPSPAHEINVRGDHIPCAICDGRGRSLGGGFFSTICIPCGGTGKVIKGITTIRDEREALGSVLKRELMIRMGSM